MIERRKTRQIQLGKVKVGGHAPITVQSMTKTDTRDVRATVQQIWDLEAAGCDIVRCAVPVREAAEKLAEIKKKIRIPLVADIHFNYKLALIALEQGVDGLRLNPGNIGARKYVEEVVKSASERKIPIRIGVNAGSLEKDLLEKYNGPTADGMVESGLRHIHILEDCGYQEIKISLKASDPLMMIEATACSPTRSTTLFIWASPRPARRASARSNPRSDWARCSPKASATRFVSRSPPIRSKKCASASKSSRR
jgi:(E)-4-hydroxy-3-methylbut-2-enyl-diphosphate synthase